MASVTCPNCGKDNPDFLDNCQFCQTALRREATLNTGEGPTKKSTGELEAALPGWLKDARQQARDTAKEDAEKEATKPKIQKAEPPDLLAGLAFQAASEEEDVPDWLAAINPVADKGSLLSSKPAEPESSDFFAQFNQPAGNERELAEEKPVWMQDEEPAPSESDELGGLAEEVPEVSENTLDFGISTQNDADWLDNLSEPAAPQQPAEDLGWLHDLETAGSSKPPAPRADTGWPASDGSSQNDLSWLNNLGGVPTDETTSQPGSSSQADLSWLDNLGGMPLDQSAASKIPSASEFPSSQPVSSQEDLSWLNNMGGTPAEESPTAQSSSAQEDLSWLNNFGGTPTEEAPTSQPASSQEDLSWLNNLGGTPTEETPASQPTSSQEDLSWLNNLGGTPTEEAPTSQPPSSQEDMSWLNNFGSTPTEEAPTSQPTSSQEDLSWLNNMGGTPAEESPTAQPSSAQEDLSWLNTLGDSPTEEAPTSQPPSSQEDMSWLNNFGSTPTEEAPTSQPASSQEDMSWLNNFGSTPTEEAPTSQPTSSQEDMSWLNNMGGTPSEETPTSQPVSSQEDLSWLNAMGSTPVEETPATQPESSQEELSWLNTLGGTPTEETPASQSLSSQEDLGWLNNLNGPSTEQAPASQKTSPEEDMSWLNNLSGTPVEEVPVSQPASSQEDMSWLNNLGGTPTDESSTAQLESPPSDLGWMSNLEAAPVDETDTSPTVQLQGDLDWMEGLGNEPPLVAKDEPSTPSESTEEPAMPDWFTGADTQSRFSPAHTAPLSDEAVDNTPDWLKSATESASSMPPLNTSESRDWFEAHEQKAVDELQIDSESNQTRFDQDQTIQFEEPVSLTSGMPEPASDDLFSSTGDATLISNDDVDSLFDVDMPDWLSQPAADSAGEQIAPEQGNIPASANDSLAPVDLPSWVQAMRPVESVIESKPVLRADDQPAEREGPLAGLSGVIPLAPIGSAQRPKAVSLKLHASEEQQLTATLLEQIIASETTAHPFRAPAFVASQRTLRWVLTGLFLMILGVVIGFGSQRAQITIPGSIMNEINSMANTIQALPETAPVLVVIDYEPALAGEMEATAGPLLDQIVIARHPKLTFVSTSPNGSALSERLLRNTGISQMENSLGYLRDSDYFIAGYLSGGLPGVRGFIEQPQGVMPSLQVSLFSDFAAVIVLTDQAESGQTWIEQITLAKQSNAGLASQPLLMVTSAQAGPMLRPYISSNQVNGMISGLADASRYEFMNNSRPGIARTYWDAFGVGLFLAVISIVIGSLWNIISGFRARRTQANNG